MNITVKEPTEQEMVEIARMDLERRLSKIFDISVDPKSALRIILWERSLECRNWDAFKDSYVAFEKDLRRWLDSQRWLHKVDFSDCWLSFESSDRDYTYSAKFVVCKSA